MGFKFEQLKIWQLALEYNGQLSDVAKSFPKDELSKKEFSRFLIIANRSALEVIACLYLARQRKMISEQQFSDFYNRYEKLIAMIALIKTLNSDDTKG